jgi:hypothetical protein
MTNRNEANVQIEKKLSRNNPLASAASGGMQAAREHAALLPTTLALTRWTRGGDIPHVFGVESRPRRAAWLGQIQQDLQSWLEAGGFHQSLQETTVCPVCASPTVDSVYSRTPASDMDGRLPCPLPFLRTK